MEKYKKIKKGMENLVGKRFSVDSLNAHLSKLFKEEIKVEDVNVNDDDFGDYNLLFESTNPDTYGFFDIYYLPMRKPGYDGETIYITEVAYEFA